MKIIIDAMGGDNAPLEIVKGALLGMEHWGVEVLLTGDTEAILRALRDCGHDTIPRGMEIVHTTETVEMCDDPSKVFRHKKDTSMGVGLTLLRDGQGRRPGFRRVHRGFAGRGHPDHQAHPGHPPGGDGPGDPHHRAARPCSSTAGPTPSAPRST